MLPAGNSVVYRLGKEQGRGALVHLINITWPGAIFQVLKTETSEEVFAYQDLDAQKAWDKDGGTPENLGKMIQLIIDWEKDTVEVIGDPDPTTSSDSLLLYIDKVFVKQSSGNE